MALVPTSSPPRCPEATPASRPPLTAAAYSPWPFIHDASMPTAHRVRAQTYFERTERRENQSGVSVCAESLDALDLVRRRLSARTFVSRRSNSFLTTA
jgi:hypothetical protein